MVLYAVVRRRLPATKGFRLGRWEIPVIVVSLVWLAFEMSIFRDSSFKDPWIYTAVMMGIGVIYFIYLLLTRKNLAMPGTGTEPVADVSGGDGSGNAAPGAGPGEPTSL